MKNSTKFVIGMIIIFIIFGLIYLYNILLLLIKYLLSLLANAIKYVIEAIVKGLFGVK